MIFGYALAVVAGFLLTAVRNWTGLPTPSGAPLAAIFALWLAARVLVLGPWPSASLAANALFPLAVAACIAVPLVRSGNRRNYFFVALLAMAAAASVAVHLSLMGLLEAPASIGIQAGLDLVLFIVAVVAGRVTPMFTNNGVPGAGASRHPAVERLALGSVLALLVLDLLGIRGIALAVLAAAAAVAHAVRLALWRPWRTARVPLVWILHAAYAWIAVHLVLRSLAALGLVAPSFAIHALTIGAIGGMTLGMMTRTARGHTGMPLTAGRAEIACYILVMAAAIARVFGGLLLPEAYVSTLFASAACWCVAFAVYCVRYAPLLTRARVDGKPG
jgi:uncharacterized protein involved in response to NO